METPADSAKVEADTAAVAQTSAVSAKDSLAAALKGETAAASSANIEALKKEHPLLAVLQLNQSGVGCIVGYADYKDTADVNRILNMKAVKEVMPRDLKLMWGVTYLRIVCYQVYRT